ncbi:MAG: DUF1565 domain-containing protein [Planctomycetes bacterium]|nr:DUF1565 domain-containing protein [Planctomycetota bacterium]
MKFPHALALLVTASIAAQQEIWVEPVNGNDGNPATYGQPLRTLTAAVGLAGPGDRIHLLEGTYGPSHNGETLPIQIGQANQPGLVIRGIGDVVFDLAGSTSTFLYLVGGASGTRITNITVQNTDQAGWWTRVINSGSGVNSGNAAMNVEIDRCRFIDCNRGIVLWTNDIVTGWRVHDNLFVNCGNDAILEYTGTNEFFCNTFHTGAYKAYISDSLTSLCYDNLIMSYAIAFENNNSAALLNRYQGNWLYQCAIVQQGAGMASALPASNVIGTDPMLVNPAAGDYHLQATSPVIDAGVMPPFARADLDANSRLVDGDGDGILEVDVGCYESTPIHLDVTWDPVTGLMYLNGSTTIAGTYGFVAFSFDDGLWTFPGQGPILIDQATYVPFFLQGPLPQQWVLPFGGAVLPPGFRLVMQILGIGPSHRGSAVFGGNQVWAQL